MLTRMTKGKQITIPAYIRKDVGIDEGTMLDIGVDKTGKKVVIEPIQTKTLDELFKEADAIKNKTNKSIEELEEEYERENMLH